MKPCPLCDARRSRLYKCVSCGAEFCGCCSYPATDHSATKPKKVRICNPGGRIECLRALRAKARGE